jgi:hypothetical protein
MAALSDAVGPVCLRLSRPRFAYNQIEDFLASHSSNL